MESFAANLHANKVFNCDLCQHLLTFPVRHVKGTGNICDSCFEIHRQEDWVFFENSKLEIIMSQMRFSCKYKDEGCTERILYPDLTKHIQYCRYQTVICCFYEDKQKKCLWTGNINEFMDHACEDHVEHILRSENDCYEFEYDLEKLSDPMTKILYSFDRFLLFQVKIYKGKVVHVVCDLLLPMMGPNYKIFAQYKSETVVTKVHCKPIPYNGFQSQSSSELSVDAFKHYREFPRLQIKFKPIDDVKISAEVMQNLDCPVCKETMRPQIYMCRLGHSVCHRCKPRLRSCPTCREPLTTIRNYALENVVRVIKHPCSYGCPQSVRLSEIGDHEDACTFKRFACPMCDYTNNYLDFKQHCQKDHVVRLFSGNIYSGRFDPTLRENRFVAESFCFYFDDATCNAFVLIVSYVRGEYIWVVKDCDRYEAKEMKYLFEIGISNDPERRKFIKVEPCLPFDSSMERIAGSRVSFTSTLEPYGAVAPSWSYYCKIFKE